MATITTTYKGDMEFETKLGNHTITIDVPEGMGGKDRGPTPPEYFVAALGSCVAAFAASYCNKAGLDCSDLSVDASFDKVSNPTRLTNFKLKLNLPHDGCEGREEAILRAASHCPVHQSIEGFEGLEIELFHN
ncbi:MAG: OsmC family protein [Anaerolineales bacterium]|nr:OsmC family protein [Anaerolineales bacterium]